MGDQLYIALSGIIGAGKSTLAKALGAEMNLPVYYEPVEANPYLEEFYKDKKANAFAMEIYLLHHRFRQQQRIAVTQGAVQDRSIYEDAVFVRMLNQSHDINTLDFSTYLDLFNTLTNMMRRPNLIVFLDVTPEQALANIKRRNREFEAGITLEYLQELHKAYVIFIAKISKTIPVIRIDNSNFPSADLVAAAIRVEYEQMGNVRTCNIASTLTIKSGGLRASAVVPADDDE